MDSKKVLLGFVDMLDTDDGISESQYSALVYSVSTQLKSVSKKGSTVVKAFNKIKNAVEATEGYFYLPKNSVDVLKEIINGIS